MTTRGGRWTLASATIFALASSACARTTSHPNAALRGPEPERHVLVIGIDGVRPDALVKANTPALDGLARRGYLSLSASTQKSAKAISAPGWSSILTGVEASQHRVTDNESAHKWDRGYPSFLARAAREGKQVGVFANWPTIFHLVERSELRQGFQGGDDGVTQQACKSIAAGPLDAYFVHLDAPDAAGHHSGFSAENPEYVSAIEASDKRIGRLLNAVAGQKDRWAQRWLVIVTTDHGGKGKSHGNQDKDNQNIFIYMASDFSQHKGACGGSHLDIAPTVGAFLGLESMASAGLAGRDLAEKYGESHSNRYAQGLRGRGK